MALASKTNADRASVSSTPQKVQDYRLEAAFVSEPFSAQGLQAQPVFDEALVLVTDHPPVRRAVDLARSTILLPTLVRLAQQLTA